MDMKDASSTVVELMCLRCALGTRLGMREVSARSILCADRTFSRCSCLDFEEAQQQGDAAVGTLWLA